MMLGQGRIRTGANPQLQPLCFFAIDRELTAKAHAHNCSAANAAIALPEICWVAEWSDGRDAAVIDCLSNFVLALPH